MVRWKAYFRGKSQIPRASDVCTRKSGFQVECGGLENVDWAKKLPGLKAINMCSKYDHTIASRVCGIFFRRCTYTRIANACDVCECNTNMQAQGNHYASGLGFKEKKDFPIFCGEFATFRDIFWFFFYKLFSFAAFFLSRPVIIGRKRGWNWSQKYNASLFWFISYIYSVHELMHKTVCIGLWVIKSSQNLKILRLSCVVEKTKWRPERWTIVDNLVDL